MFKFFLADLKMLTRNRQALFWSLAFPLMFTIIFGFFFGGDQTNIGSVALINQSNTQIAANLEKAMTNSGIFKIKTDQNLDTARNNLKNNNIIGIVVIPQDFGSAKPAASTKVKVIYDPANAQSNMTIINFIQKYLTQIDFKIQKVKPTFSVEEEKTNNNNLNYFDFVLIGLIGMALMNSSIQGVAISLTKYREDKILKRITTTPVKTYKFIFAEILSRLIVNIIQISLILAIGVYYFHAHIYGNILLIYLFGILGAILFQSIGFVIASLSKTTQAAEGMSVAITIPMMFLAGVFFPIDQLPNWLYSVVQFLPLAPLLKMIRQIGLETLSPFTNINNIIIVTSWIVIMLGFAIYKFRLSDE